MTPTPYVKQTWIDGDTTKPLSAARMGVLENGIFDAHYRPCVSCFRSAAQSIPNTTATVITFDSEVYDTDNFHSTVTNTGRLTAPVAGKYMVTGAVLMTANATGARVLDLRINGAGVIDEDALVPSAAQSTYLRVSRPYLFAAADFVELLIIQTSGGALNTGAGLSQIHFSMQLESY